ncbi:MAG TPA: hypothetical protein ENJ12_00525 [Thiolapillus brandeum]|uniref:DUF883 family protein n=1 Tax=Thiolapillus brandeum TaxID=1076588 RepID=A0A831RUD2_9GAMM|nr:hypothetical protein [Thiolapillus brandeum]
MPKMTMREELEMLRREVEELKRQQQEEAVAEKTGPVEEAEALIRQKLEAAGDKVDEIRGEMKDQLEELADTLKSEYEHLSPVAAVFLFALGVVFGRVISSK